MDAHPTVPPRPARNARHGRLGHRYQHRQPVRRPNAHRPRRPQHPRAPRHPPRQLWDFPHVPCHGHVSSSPRQQVSATMTAPVPLYITSQKPKLLMQKVKPSDARSQPSTAQTDPGLIHVHSCALSGRSGTGRRGTSCAWRAGPPRAATPHKDRCSKGGWAPRRHAGQFPLPDNRWPEGRAAYPA